MTNLADDLVDAAAVQSHRSALELGEHAIADCILDHRTANALPKGATRQIVRRQIPPPEGAR